MIIQGKIPGSEAVIVHVGGGLCILTPSLRIFAIPADGATLKRPRRKKERRSSTGCWQNSLIF